MTAPSVADLLDLLREAHHALTVVDTWDVDLVARIAAALSVSPEDPEPSKPNIDHLMRRGLIDALNEEGVPAGKDVEAIADELIALAKSEAKRINAARPAPVPAAPAEPGETAAVDKLRTDVPTIVAVLRDPYAGLSADSVGPTGARIAYRAAADLLEAATARPAPAEPTDAPCWPGCVDGCPHDIDTDAPAPAEPAERDERPTQAEVLAWTATHWPDNVEPLHRAAKLCEEAGEVMGAVIKMSEGRKTLSDLAQETAQVTLCAMALAESAGFDLDTEVAAEFARVLAARPVPVTAAPSEDKA